MTGVSISIYRTDLGDCTNRGVTSPERAKGKIFVVFDAAIQRGNYRLAECQGDDRFVCLQIVRRRFGARTYMHLEPMGARPEGSGGPMAGGNLGFTTDSRFREVSDYPLSIHDRFETPQLADYLSR